MSANSMRGTYIQALDLPVTLDRKVGTSEVPCSWRITHHHFGNRKLQCGLMSSQTSSNMAALSPLANLIEHILHVKQTDGGTPHKLQDLN
mgnify:CR=1 FL=1